MIQRLDGSTVSVTLVGAPIRSAGKVSGTVLVLHDMTQERQYIANLSWQATHDALTGLANRREFEYRLEQVLQQADASAQRAACPDVPRPRPVQTGQRHLWSCGGRRTAAAHLRAAAIGLARGRHPGAAGGRRVWHPAGELPGTGGREKIAENLRQTVQSLHFVWKGRPFVTTVSIGLVHIAQTPTTLETSLRAADMACYMAKEKGRNRVQVYHADDSELSLRFGEMAWVQRLHMALEENRFCLYSQEICTAWIIPRRAMGTSKFSCACTTRPGE